MPARLAVLILVLQCCGLCAPIRVPVVWDGDNSEVQPAEETFSVEQFKPKDILQHPVPIEYFKYTAKKPQFAVDIAAFHGVQSPENHFKARPVRPFNGKNKPQLGNHRIQDPNRPVFHQFQEYINQNEPIASHAIPVSSNYEVFHPYKAEEPGLQDLYKDPFLDKIRNDIRDSSQRLEKQQNDDGKPDVSKDEYLESLEQTDRKKAPQRNIPVPYEIHRPQRLPIYYRPAPAYPNRDHILNQKFKHPWNQNFVKIRPAHYRPLKNHLQKLRQHHALTYDDERNQYPQVPVLQHYEEPSDGYDIYEKGKEKYVNLRNNLDESINNLVLKNRPITSQKLELQSEEKPIDDEEEEFVPIKNYAQVRKTETTKHLPKQAAFDDAESYEEIKNAPRLREAIKSTKAQTVYTEEGYEDSAYDHAGEQKHASDHEAHGGFLKENELSGGKYKAPSVSASYKDGGGSAYKDQVLDGKIWKENNKENQKEEESEDYSEDGHEHSVETDKYSHGPINKINNARSKRQDFNDSYDDASIESKISDNTTKNDKLENNKSADNPTATEESTTEEQQHDVNKRETNFKVPEIDLDSTYLTEKDILEIAKEKIVAQDLSEKYPYYFKNLRTINKNSPIRYAENLKFMPRKTDGGTEFYDSRSQLECPEVDDKVDALPEKFKKKGHPDKPEEGAVNENNEKGESSENLPRLTGLGDKIDCFKAKYFGENPLDSPFFNEEIISEPEPVVLPNLASFKLKNSNDIPLSQSASINVPIKIEKLTKSSDGDLYEILQKLKSKNRILQDSLSAKELDKETFKPEHMLVVNNSTMQSDSKSNHSLNNLQNYFTFTSFGAKENLTSDSSDNENNGKSLFEFGNETSSPQPEEMALNSSTKTRQKRAAPFVYEPYKIIRDVQAPDSKKTTTTGNISPLIKQLQSSKVIDAVVKSNNDKDQPLKVSLGSRTYKDIGKRERERTLSTDSKESAEASIVDVSVDKRRGEPRYEIRPSNHKAEYSPVENKKAMSVQDYQIHTKNSTNSDSAHNARRPSARSLYNIANNVKKSDEFQNLQASSTERRTVTSSPQTVKKKIEQTPDEDVVESDEDYEDEYDDEEDEEEIIPSTTTTTTTSTTSTARPSFRKKMRLTTTTEPPTEENTEETPKLRLVTRFRNSHLAKNTPDSERNHEKTDDFAIPTYREKKKTSTKSTLLTDTKKYGDGDDDMRKEEIDAMIGVKQNMDDYMPLYEKEALKKKQNNKEELSEEDNSEETDEESAEDDEEEDDDDDVEEDDEDEEDEEEGDDGDQEETSKVTTESSKRTLVRTTDAPPSTTEARSAKLESKPIISRKKIAIHKELPVNKSSPHITEFKQDIEEVEIIKEIPRKITERKPNKNLEVLDLYKDDNLATDINKLGAVEIFSENLDLKNGPKHGGNYRRAPELEEKELSESLNNDASAPKDAEASQTQNKKLVEIDSNTSRKMHGGNLKSISDAKRSRGEKKFEKFIELKDITEKPATKSLHGGNLKAVNDRSRRRGANHSEKLIELSDDHEDEDDDSIKPKHGGNFKPYSGANSRNSGRGLHGGNYRSSRLVQAEDVKDESNSRLEKAKSEAPKKLNSADLLNSFALAVPILTTTPSYILDPSKRMYYYVDA